MEILLAELLELTVEIKSGTMQQEFTDVGTLEACDREWLQLRKADGQLLCFPFVNVRNVRRVALLV